MYFWLYSWCFLVSHLHVYMMSAVRILMYHLTIVLFWQYSRYSVSTNKQKLHGVMCPRQEESYRRIFDSTYITRRGDW